MPSRLIYDPGQERVAPGVVVKRGPVDGLTMIPGTRVGRGSRGAALEGDVAREALDRLDRHVGDAGQTFDADIDAVFTHRVFCATMRGQTAFVAEAKDGCFRLLVHALPERLVRHVLKMRRSPFAALL